MRFPRHIVLYFSYLGGFLRAFSKKGLAHGVFLQVIHLILTKLRHFWVFSPRPEVKFFHFGATSGDKSMGREQEILAHNLS